MRGFHDNPTFGNSIEGADWVAVPSAMGNRQNTTVDFNAFNALRTEGGHERNFLFGRQANRAIIAVNEEWW